MRGVCSDACMESEGFSPAPVINLLSCKQVRGYVYYRVVDLARCAIGVDLALCAIGVDLARCATGVDLAQGAIDRPPIVRVTLCMCFD